MDSSDVDRGWAWVVLAASFLIHIMSFGVTWSTGVYNTIFLESFGQSTAMTAWAGALPGAVMYAVGPISSMLCNKYGVRPVIFVGGIISGSGLSLSFFAPNLYYLYFTFGLLSGLGFGIIFIPSIYAISQYFDKKLSIAAGIASSGIGLGTFLYPAIIRAFVHMYEWRGSLLILGALSLNMSVLGLLIRPKQVSTKKEKRPILDVTSFKKKSYIVLCFNNFLFYCGISAVYIHLTAFAERKGIDPDRSASLISGIGISNLIGRIGFGLIAHHPAMDAFVVYGVSFGLAGVCICIIPFLNSYANLMACVVAFGLFSGSFGTLLVVILKTLLGTERFANGYGCLLLFEAAGQLLGGFFAGAVFDATNSYKVAFITSGALAICSAIIMVQPYLYTKSQRFYAEQEQVELTVSIAKSFDKDEFDR